MPVPDRFFQPGNAFRLERASPTDSLGDSQRLVIVDRQSRRAEIGENFNGPESMVEAFRAAACDYVMPDASRVGGVSGWIQAAGIAAANRIQMSSHLLPEISAHLLAATPTCHYLEYVECADAILEEPLQIVDGFAHVPDRPGLGLAWRSEAVKSLALDRS